MSDQLLRAELDRVARRFGALARGVGLFLFWLTLGFAAVTLLLYLRAQPYQVAGIAAIACGGATLILTPILIVWARRAKNILWLARRIEQTHPDLDARLLAALEQHPDKNGLGFLQQMVIDQAVRHAQQKKWAEIVPSGKLNAVRLASWIMFLVTAALAVAVGGELRANWGRTLVQPLVRKEAPFTIKVEPENASVERGTPLLVMAHFGSQRLPNDVELLYRDGENDVQRLSMSKSLDDPLFAVRIPSVKRDGMYAVRYGGAETEWYKVSVFDYPQLKQADANLKFPEYTGQPEKELKDTRSVSGVEGTQVTLSFQLNKPVSEARLVPAARRPGDAPAGARGPGRAGRGNADVVAAATAAAVPIDLKVDPNDPTKYTLSFSLTRSQNYQLQLIDADKRENRDRPTLALNVTVNRPPELRVLSPNRDLDVSALEEITVRTQVFDDYGVKRAGVTYNMVGQPPQDLILAENVPAKERKELSQVISLEKLGAAPDQMLSYHLWVEDIGPDGKVRRTDGSLFFADVRPFEEIYRQGEELAQGEEEQQQRQQQQRQQQQGQQNQNGQQAEQVANTLKQVIAATWNIMRRETAETPSEQFVPDVTSLGSSVSRIKTQTEGLGERVTDERAAAFLASALKNIDGAAEQLKAAETGPSVKPMEQALAFEQNAYNDLLKLRAREFEVTRSNRQQQQGQQSAAQQRRQQQVNNTNPRNQQNPYQARRTPQQQQQQQQPEMNQQAQQETDEQRETRQVLSRLRELAQRQEDLNRQMQETQAALQQAQNQEQREEIQRQLANLRDQQQQQLRDADDLRDRMDQPQNQEGMADARQQLEQTRNNLQQASQALNQGQMQQASAAGQRAGEQLNNLQNQMRRAAAGQFGEQMTQMRQDARELEQRQQEIDQQLANLNQPAQNAQTGLRDPSQANANQQRQQIAQQLAQQRQNLDTLMNNMQQTIEQADQPQPLLSRQLYDTYRSTQQQQPDRSLDSSRQLVQQGLLQEARQTNNDASQVVTRLREGVDQAAAGVLGDETAALRRAREQLDELQQQIEREQGRAAAQAAASQPGRGGERQLANGTQPGRGGQAGTQPGRGGAGTQPDERQVAQNDGRGGQAGQPGARGGQNQPGGQLAQNDPNGQQPGQGAQSGARGGQNGNQPDERQLAQGGQGQPGARGGQQGQEGQPGARGGQGQPGEQQGDQQARGGQGQPGEQQGDQQARGGQGQPGQRGGQPGARGGQGQPGEQGDAQQARGGQPGARGGQGQAGEQQGNQQARGGQGQPGRGQPGARGGQGQPGEGEQDPQGLAAGNGRGAPGLRPDGQPGENQQDQQGQPGQGGAQARGGRGQNGNAQPGEAQPNGRGGDGNQVVRTENGGNNNDGGNGLGGANFSGPITGNGYRNFADGLRDVEEVVNDPRLRDQAATIRQQVTNLRQDYNRTSRPPNWNIVQDTVNRPLQELRTAVNQEIQRRESAQAAIPLDRDAVPPAYQDQVRTYYERLGSGK
jgi:hypothetical protein